jgi:hypothetical protein
MAGERSVRRYTEWYRRLLRLYPKAYRDRFGEGLEQTFNDLCRERAEARQPLFTEALWMFVETGAGVLGENMKLVATPNRSVLAIVLGTALLLLVPLVAMQFTDEVVWGPFDFAFAGVVIGGTGLTFEWAVRKMGNVAYRAGVGVALAAGFMLFWGNAAVGVIGDEDEPANLMYLGVLAVCIIGAIIARFRAPGMARALLATAIAQAAVTVIALAAGKQDVPGASLTEILWLNAFFITLWVGSAVLFQRASATGSKPNALPG